MILSSRLKNRIFSDHTKHSLTFSYTDAMISISYDPLSKVKFQWNQAGKKRDSANLLTPEHTLCLLFGC